MKKRFTKMVSLILLLSIVMTAFPATALAVEEGSSRGPEYIYQTEYLPQREVSVSGYAGNQSGSQYLTPGDGMFYTMSGGPTISTSLTLQFAYGVASVSVSSAIGNKAASSGSFIILKSNQPSGYYKLWLTKTLLIKPYVVYRKRSGAANTTWEIYYTGYIIVNDINYPKTKATLVYVSA